MSREYPRDVPPRFELRQGKYGPYFHDTHNNFDMPLSEVLNTLNRYQLRKAQLTWYVSAYGEPKRTFEEHQHEQDRRGGLDADRHRRDHPDGGCRCGHCEVTERQMLKRGDKVEKIDGDVRFPGVVVGVYETLSGQPRIVVECTAPGVAGLQHIYRPDQFRKLASHE
jgi:hypothetical protein